MTVDAFELAQLAAQGFGCSQVLVLRALQADGRSSPELVRAVAGLQRGLGSGELCGALSGGCCVLGLRAGHGTPEESPSPDLEPMLRELVDWFSATYGTLRCHELLGGDPRNQVQRCPGLIAAVAEKVDELLARSQADAAR